MRVRHQVEKGEFHRVSVFRRPKRLVSYGEDYQKRQAAATPGQRSVTCVVARVRAVARPQLAAGNAVVSREIQRAVEDGEGIRSGARAGPSC